MKKLLLLSLILLISATIYGQMQRFQINVEEGFSDVEVLSPTTFIVAEMWNNKIYKTTDGGQNWSFQTITPDYPASIKAISYVSEEIGFVQTTELINGGIFAGGYEFDNLYKTIDGGVTWTNIRPVPLDSSEYVSSIGSMFFFNENIGFCNLYNTLYRTTDGGSKWEAQGNFRTNTSFDYALDGTAYMTQSYANNIELDEEVEFYYTDDFGASWTETILRDVPLGTNSRVYMDENKVAYIDFDSTLYTFKDGVHLNTVELAIDPFALIGGEEVLLLETVLSSVNPPTIQLELFKSSEPGGPMETIDFLEDGYIYLMNYDYGFNTGVAVGTQGNIIVFKKLSTSIDPVHIEEDLLLFPNPVPLGTDIQLNTKNKNIISWVITNTSGQQLLKEIAISNTIPTSKIKTAGLYHITFTTKTEMIASSFIIE